MVCSLGDSAVADMHSAAKAGAVEELRSMIAAGAVPPHFSTLIYTRARYLFFFSSYLSSLKLSDIAICQP